MNAPTKFNANMVIGLSIFMLIGTTLIAYSQTNSPPTPAPNPVAVHDTVIVGLINLNDFKAALLEIQDSPSNHRWTNTAYEIVSEGHKWEDGQVKGAHVQIEISRIDFTNNLVQARENGKDVTYHFKSGNEPATKSQEATLRLDNVKLDRVLELYSTLSGRSILLHPAVKTKTIVTLSANPQTKADAISYLEKTFKERGFSAVADGERLVRVVQNEMANDTNDYSAPLPNDGPAPVYFDLGSADFNSVSRLYGQLTSRKVTHPERTPEPAITFHPGPSLTRNDLIHALDVLLGWQGIKIVKIDDSTSQVVRINP